MIEDERETGDGEVDEDADVVDEEDESETGDCEVDDADVDDENNDPLWEVDDAVVDDENNDLWSRPLCLVLWWDICVL